MRKNLTSAGILSLAMLLSVAPAVQAQQVKVLKQWRGSVDDLGLLKQAPKGGYITDAITFNKVWKAWNGQKKMPKVDFKKRLVVHATTRGSRLNLRPSLKDGNLRTLALATRDLRPGFRFHMCLINREGITSVNGKKLD